MAKAQDLRDLAAELREQDRSYCVDSDGSTKANGADNWALVDGCGANSAAIWLQSYVSFVLLS